jgi:FtsP/CotA-like multicopper oxidase with cupredoxin domain
MNRREFVQTGLSGLATVAAGGLLLGGIVNGRKTSVAAEDVAFAESEGTAEGIREFNLKAEVAEIDIGAKKTFKAWTYNSQSPGPEIRVKEGEILRVVLENNLPEPTTIHWHGLPVPNTMDGVPDITQEPIQPGETFVYEFAAQPAGSYLYHSHVGYQLDQGLYGGLIVEPQRESLSYDKEYTLILSDWVTVDGGGPEAAKAGRTRGGMGMMGRRMRGMMGRHMMGRRVTDDMPLLEPDYNAYTINGKLNRANEPLMVKKGDKVRLRIMNPASASIFTLRLSGHPLLITHADGRPVEPLEVDALRVGMGERYDVLFTANNPGRWSLYTLKDGTPAGGYRLATMLYEGIQETSYSVDSLLSRFSLNYYSDLEGIPEETVPQVNGAIDRQFNLTLSGGMMASPYWTINGQVWPDADDLVVYQGERIRINYFNHSMMPHPMHLHGHFFEIVQSGRKGKRVHKDTLIIEPHTGSGAIEFVADNPGDWFHHCHNLYHMMGGMANVVRYG